MYIYPGTRLSHSICGILEHQGSGGGETILWTEEDHHVENYTLGPAAMEEREQARHIPEMPQSCASVHLKVPNMQAASLSDLSGSSSGSF